jgi:cytochrome P450
VRPSALGFAVVEPIANLLLFARDPLELVSRCARRGDFVRLRVGPLRCAFVNHPEFVRQLAVAERTRLARGVSTTLLRTVLGNGLLVSEGQVWTRQRRSVQLALQRSAAHLWTAIGPSCERTLALWRQEPRRLLHDDVRRLTSDIAARAVLGFSPTMNDGGSHPALELMAEGRSFSVLAAFPFLRDLPTSGNRVARRTRRLLDALVHESIDRASPAEPTVVGSLLAVAPHMTRSELRDELMTLLFTAYDTTASTICWTLYLLAQHPSVEERLRCEPPASRYLEWIVLEALRLYPPVPIQTRDVLSECTVGGHALAAHTTVLWSQWLIHRDRRWFERPERFEPERWASGLLRDLPPFAFFPFGGGRRTCVGEGFATIIVSGVLKALIGRARFDFEAAHSVVPESIVTLQPRGGLPVRVIVGS